MIIPGKTRNVNIQRQVLELLHTENLEERRRKKLSITPLSSALRKSFVVAIQQSQRDLISLYNRHTNENRAANPPQTVPCTDATRIGSMENRLRLELLHASQLHLPSSPKISNNSQYIFSSSSTPFWFDDWHGLTFLLQPASSRHRSHPLPRQRSRTPPNHPPPPVSCRRTSWIAARTKKAHTIRKRIEESKELTKEKLKLSPSRSFQNWTTGRIGRELSHVTQKKNHHLAQFYIHSEQIWSDKLANFSSKSPSLYGKCYVWVFPERKSGKKTALSCHFGGFLSSLSKSEMANL